MIVIVLTNCPPGLRGFLTRWLLEISAGVFIGNPSARIRDALWEEVRQHVGQGGSLPAHTTNNEQGFTFRTHDHAWHPVDHEGLTLIRRPTQKHSKPPAPRNQAGARRPSVAASAGVLSNGSNISIAGIDERAVSTGGCNSGGQVWGVRSLARRWAGVSQLRVMRGRSLSSAATASRCSRVWMDKSVPLGASVFVKLVGAVT